MGRIGPPDQVWKKIVLGGLWGWLPCGLVYSALAAASVTGSVSSGAAFMFCFGLGTIPALVVTGGAANKIAGMLRQRSARRALGTLLIVLGCWTIYAALAPMHGGQHRHASTHDHEMES